MNSDTLDVNEYGHILEKIELYQDLEKSITQIEAGSGISHEEARVKVLEEIKGV